MTVFGEGAGVLEEEILEGFYAAYVGDRGGIYKQEVVFTSGLEEVWSGCFHYVMCTLAFSMNWAGTSLWGGQEM